MEESKKKLNDLNYNTDKGESYYLKIYDKYFESLQDKDLNLFEIGVLKGGSLLMWRDYFKKGNIIGLDIDKIEINDSLERIHIYQGIQQDVKLLDRIRNETSKDGFDIIIDDASHIGELTKITFWHLFENHLKPGGIYVIEDWRTGYYDKWPDGKNYNFKSKSVNFIRNGIDFFLKKATNKKDSSRNNVIIKKILRRIRDGISVQKIKSHEYGMVGFVKQLIDELGMDMITSPDRGSKIPYRDSKFESIEFFKGLVFIKKPIK